MDTPCLPVGHYRLVFRSRAALRFSSHAGSAWRGAFGHALKRTVCVTREPVCQACLLFRSCPYPYLFETPPPADTGKMRRYNAVPHPFVLIPPAPGESPEGGEYVLGMTLLGRATQYLPYAVHALARAAEEGIGPDRTPLDLTWISQQDAAGQWTTIYQDRGQDRGQDHEGLAPLPPFVPQTPATPRSVLITLETPLRLRRDNDNVTPDIFRFADLFASLLRRISMLTYFHTDTPLETDFAGLTAAARALPVASRDLRWEDWTRYSSRQETLMQLGGLIGTLTLEGADLAPFWPYLWLGQWTHAGKATSMGLGRYTLALAASLPGATAPSG